MADDISIKVGADTSSAEKNLKNLEKTAGTASASMSKAFETIRAGAIAAVAAFAGKQVFDFFKGGVDAAAEAEVSFTRMTKALELSGNAAPGVADSFRDLSDNIERVTGISAGAVQEQIAIAQAFELTNDETQSLIIAATELSAATGKDLATRVRDLGGTLNGTLGSLKKTVPELDSLSEEALRSGKAIDFILERFSGSAAKNLETFSGSVDQVGIAFGKIPEAFGQAVVENETLRSALSTLTDTFYALAQIVTDNKSSISSLITVAIDPLMGALSAAVRIVGFFNNAINGIQLAVFGLGKVFLEINEIIRDFDVRISKFTFGGKQLETATAAAEEAKQQTREYTKALQLMNDQVIKEKKAFDDINDKILNYKDVVSDATKEIKRQRLEEEKASKQRKKSAKDLKEVEKAFLDLNKKVTSDTLDALDKQLSAYEDNQDELEKIAREGVISQKKVNKLREEIESTHQRNITEILKKQAEERKREIEQTLKESNFTAIVKLALATGTASDLKKEAKTQLGTIVADVGASIISAVSQGTKGFSSLVANLVKSIPVFGNLIAAAVELGTLSPEENRKAIEDFAEGIPQAMENFNTNLGNLPDILSGVAGPLIEKILGPLFSQFIANLMKSLREWPRLVGVIAKGVAAGIRAQGGTIADAVKKAFTDIGAEWGRFFENAREFFGGFSEKVRAAFATVFMNNPILNELKTMRSGMTQLMGIVRFFVQLFQSIPGILMEIRDLFSGIGEQFTGVFENIGTKISDGFNQIIDAFRNLISGIVSAIKALPKQIKTAFGNLAQGFKNALSEVFSSFFETFSNLADKLRGFISGGGISSVGGGGGGKLGVFGLASGITEVPSGFPNDTFPARLTSGERVVDANANRDLKDFLESAKSGGLGNAEMIALLRDISSKLGGGSQTVEVVIDKKVLGRTILDMNRRNERINA